MAYFRLRYQTYIGTALENINTKIGRNVLIAKSKSILTILQAEFKND